MELVRDVLGVKHNEGVQFLIIRKVIGCSSNIHHFIKAFELLEELLVLFHVVESVDESNDWFGIICQTVNGGDDFVFQELFGLLQEVDIFLFTFVNNFYSSVEKGVSESSLDSEFRFFSLLLFISIRFWIDDGESHFTSLVIVIELFEEVDYPVCLVLDVYRDFFTTAREVEIDFDVALNCFQDVFGSLAEGVDLFLGSVQLSIFCKASDEVHHYDTD